MATITAFIRVATTKKKRAITLLQQNRSFARAMGQQARGNKSKGSDEPSRESAV